jgi:hypothetical protein
MNFSHFLVIDRLVQTSKFIRNSSNKICHMEFLNKLKFELISIII